MALNIIAARKNKGMTAAVLCKRLNVSPPTMCEMEKGGNLTIDTIKRIALVMHCDITELFDTPEHWESPARTTEEQFFLFQNNKFVEQNILSMISRRGTSMAKLATKMGIRLPTLSLIIHGNPCISSLVRVATALDCNEAEFFKRPPKIENK